MNSYILEYGSLPPYELFADVIDPGAISVKVSIRAYGALDAAAQTEIPGCHGVPRWRTEPAEGGGSWLRLPGRAYAYELLRRLLWVSQNGEDRLEAAELLLEMLDHWGFEWRDEP